MLTYNGCITCSKKDMGLIVVFGGNDELQDYELAKFTALSSINYRPQSGRVGVASDASKVGLAAVLFQETPWGTTKSGDTLWVERPIAF